MMTYLVCCFFISRLFLMIIFLFLKCFYIYIKLHTCYKLNNTYNSYIPNIIFYLKVPIFILTWYAKVSLNTFGSLESFLTAIQYRWLSASKFEVRKMP